MTVLTQRIRLMDPMFKGLSPFLQHSNSNVSPRRSRFNKAVPTYHIYQS